MRAGDLRLLYFARNSGFDTTELLSLGIPQGDEGESYRNFSLIATFVTLQVKGFNQLINSEAGDILVMAHAPLSRDCGMEMVPTVRRQQMLSEVVVGIASTRAINRPEEGAERGHGS